MKKRSLVALAAILAMIVFVFSACSNNGNDNGANIPTSESESESEPATDAEEPSDNQATEEPGGERVEISFWYGWGGTEGEVMEKLIKKFNDSQDGIFVKGTVEGDYSKQLTAITAGDPPDVASNFGNASVVNGENGANTPLDEYMTMSGMTADHFVPGAIKQQQYNGKTYALPLAMHFSMLFYNKDLLAQAGYDKPPETVQQLFEYFDTLSKIEASGEIKSLAIAPQLPIYDYAYLFGGNFVDKDGNITPQDPGFIEAMKQSAALWKKAGGSEKINAFTATLGGWLTAEDPFFTGKYAMTFGGEWTGTFIKQFAPNLNYGIAPLPYDENHPELAGSASVDTSTLYIPKGAKHPDEAWAFINWFMQPENIAEFDAGIGNLTPVIEAIDSPMFDNVVGFKEFLEGSRSPNLKSFPSSPFMGVYTNEIGIAFNEVLLGNISAEQGAKQIADKMAAELPKFKK